MDIVFEQVMWSKTYFSIFFFSFSSCMFVDTRWLEYWRGVVRCEGTSTNRLRNGKIGSYFTPLVQILCLCSWVCLLSSLTRQGQKPTILSPSPAPRVSQLRSKIRWLIPWLVLHPSIKLHENRARSFFLLLFFRCVIMRKFHHTRGCAWRRVARTGGDRSDGSQLYYMWLESASKSNGFLPVPLQISSKFPLKIRSVVSFVILI